MSIRKSTGALKEPEVCSECPTPTYSVRHGKPLCACCSLGPWTFSTDGKEHLKNCRRVGAQKAMKRAEHKAAAAKAQEATDDKKRAEVLEWIAFRKETGTAGFRGETHRRLTRWAVALGITIPPIPRCRRAGFAGPKHKTQS